MCRPLDHFNWFIFITHWGCIFHIPSISAHNHSCFPNPQSHPRAVSSFRPLTNHCSFPKPHIQTLVPVLKTTHTKQVSEPSAGGRKQGDSLFSPSGNTRQHPPASTAKILHLAPSHSKTNDQSNIRWHCGWTSYARMIGV